jgi:3-isopropylmalate dehydrogenase
MMLDYFNLKEEADLVRKAVEWTIKNGMVTKDIDPINFYFMSTVGDLIIDYVNGRIPGTVNKKNIELRKSTII